MTAHGCTFVLKSGLRVEGRFSYLWDSAPSSLVVVCQQCGEVWARLLAEGAQDYEPVCHLCEGCGSGIFSTLLCAYRDYDLPRELWEREVELVAKWGLHFNGTVYV